MAPRLFGLAVLLAVSGGATGQPAYRVSQDVRIEADTLHALGEVGVATVRNDSYSNVELQPSCAWQLERWSEDGWTTVRSNPCMDMFYEVIRPGESSEHHFLYPIEAEAFGDGAWYRLAMVFWTGEGPPDTVAFSNAFRFVQP